MQAKDEKDSLEKQLLRTNVLAGGIQEQYEVEFSAETTDQMALYRTFTSHN